MADTGDMEFLNTCRRHLDIFKAEARWNSSNVRLGLDKLQAKLDGGYPIAKDVSDEFTRQEIVVNDRQDVYARVAPFAKSARRYLRSCGATENEIKDGTAHINALLGQVKRQPKPLANTDAPAAVGEASNAKAQLSYDAQYANLQVVRAFFGNVSAFQPNEDGLKLTMIDTFITECDDANVAVSAGFVPLSAAWNLRDEKLYTDADSILDDFRLAKEYYKSLYQPKDPQYKAITAPDMKLRDNSR